MGIGAPLAAPERLCSHPVLDPAQEPVGLSKGPPPAEQRSASDDSSTCHFDAAAPPEKRQLGLGGDAGAAVKGMGQSDDQDSGGRPLRSLSPSMERSYSSLHQAANVTVDHARKMTHPKGDEALRRWKAAAAAAGDTECYTMMEPLENGWVDEGIAIVTMLALFGFVLVGPALALWLTWRTVCGDAVAAAVLAVLCSTALFPVHGFWEPWAHWHVWRTWRRYHRLRWVTPARPYLQPHKHYLFLHFPHAVFPMGSWLSTPVTGDQALTGIPERARGAIATVLVTAPVLRQIFGWMGCFPADRAAISARLAVNSVGFLPEGIAGIFQGANMHHERIFFSPRKGIIAIALRTGTDIVPVYFVGQSQMFTFWGSAWLSRKCRMSVGLFFGRWGLPLPHKCDIVSVLGPPIPVKQVDNPSYQEVDLLHAQVAEAVRKLYLQHRHLVPGFEQKDLEVT